MKKISFALLILTAAMLFSSCVVVHADVKEEEVHTYKFFFDNDTRIYIYDWYLKDEDGNNWTKGDGYYPVAPDDRDCIYDIPEGLYQVWYCIDSGRRKDVYTHTKNFFEINSDVVFSLKYEECTERSAVNNASGEKRLVLVDSNGNEYPLN